VKRFVFLSLSLLVLILVPGCITVQPTAPNPIQPVGTPPVIGAFSSNPSEVNSNGTSTLLWNVTGANSVSIDQGIGLVDVAGTRIVSPVTSTVYTISATNAAGTITRSATTTVNSTPVPIAAPTDPLIMNAATVAITPDDVKVDGWGFGSTMQPFSNDGPISAYSITFKRGQEFLTNSVFTYATTGAAEYRYYSGYTRSGSHRAQDIHTLGEILAYSETFLPSNPDNEATYTTRFVKDNVYVELGTINNFQELQTYAKLIIARIK
jgi:hypothetical protein